jgi:hypothetical protein
LLLEIYVLRASFLLSGKFVEGWNILPTSSGSLKSSLLMNEMFWGSSKVVSKSKPDAGVRNKFVDGDAYEVVSFEA